MKRKILTWIKSVRPEIKCHTWPSLANLLEKLSLIRKMSISNPKWVNNWTWNSVAARKTLKRKPWKCWKPTTYEYIATFRTLHSQKKCFLFLCEIVDWFTVPKRYASSWYIKFNLRVIFNTWHIHNSQSLVIALDFGVIPTPTLDMRHVSPFYSKYSKFELNPNH